MSLSTLPAPRSRPTPLPFPVRRRIATYFTDGVDGMVNLAATLQQRGYAVHDLSVDIRDGVTESSMECTVMVGNDDVDGLLDGLRQLPSVVSSELV